MRKIIIAIDGFSSCGKSTLAKALSKTLGYAYIDTGAMYRSVTLYFIENDINLHDEEEVDKALKNINIHFENDGNGNYTFLNGRIVEDEIRQMYISEKVSEIAAISAIRRAMVKQQKVMGDQKGIVMDGRDIGTVVFKEAELKIFITADTEVRTKRRFNELIAKGQEVSYEAVKFNLMERDRIDSTREDSPLRKAEDAVVIDNTNLSEAEQLAMVLELSKARITRSY